MAPHKTATPPDSPRPFDAEMQDATTYHGRRALLPGIYAPTPCFFHPSTEDVDTEAITKHTIRLARAGLAGITVQGSNGEAVHLSPQERILVTRTTRDALNSSGFSHLPIIAGCGAQSTREAIAHCKDASEAGADYALVLPPSYFKASYSRQALLDFFTDLADASPVPLLIYNYPGAAAGIDLDSDFLLEAAVHPNIVGVKLTCGNVGKLARIAAATSAATAQFPRGPFFALAGSADFLLPALAVGASGALAGLANIAPKACVALFNAHAKADHAAAAKLQTVLARADWIVQRGGVPGTKAALESWYGYGGVGRKPLPRWSREQVRDNKAEYEEVVRLEESL